MLRRQFVERPRRHTPRPPRATPCRRCPMANTTRAALATASIHAVNLAAALSEALDSSGDHTATPREVADIIDDALRELHQIRQRAVAESRRRHDAAMARSAELLQKGRRAR